MNYVLILASGGIDSTACINFYKKLDFEVEVLFIDFGQMALQEELEAVQKITTHYEIKLLIIRATSILKFQGGEVVGRNGYFIFSALLNFGRQTGLIAIGIHKGTPYYDSSEKFIGQIQPIIGAYSNDLIKVDAPFLKFNKKEIYNYCVSENIPLALTYSCELGKKQPCGECATCKDLILIYDS